MIDKEIIKIASNTENHGVLDKHTHFSKLKNSICGDVMKIYLIIKNDKIENFKYEELSLSVKGCLLIGMLVGRFEILAIIAVLLPNLNSN